MQEEVENKTVQLAVRSSKVTLKLLLRALRAYIRHHQNKKRLKQYAKSKDATVKGKQSVKELVGQGQGVSSMEIGDSGIKDFKKLANKYGVDFAIVKDKSGEIPKYVCFFKARDADALTSAFNAYTADVLKSKEKPSVLKQLSKLKEIVAALPAKVLQKQKERVQDR